MKYILILFAILQCYFLQSQCTYLAYDGFDYSANMPMEGAAGGTGWDIPWNVQNEDETVPGYNAVASSLPYSDLQVEGDLTLRILDLSLIMYHNMIMALAQQRGIRCGLVLY